MMKKEYMMPSIEIIVSQLHLEMMAGHSDDWADAKGMNFQSDDEQNEMQEWDNIFSNDRKDPWNGADDIWK